MQIPRIRTTTGKTSDSEWNSIYYDKKGKVKYPSNSNDMEFNKENFPLFTQTQVTLGNQFYDYYIDTDYGYYNIKISYDIVGTGSSERIKISRTIEEGGSANYDLDAGKNYTEFNVTRMTYFPMTLQFQRKFNTS